MQSCVCAYHASQLRRNGALTCSDVAYEMVGAEFLGSSLCYSLFFLLSVNEQETLRMPRSKILTNTIIGRNTIRQSV